MSDQNFPMPKSLDAPRQVPGFDRPATPPPVSDYAPRPAPQRGLEAVAQAIERDTLRTPPSAMAQQQASTHTAAIRESIKKLTHREMREMVAMIFAAKDKLASDRRDHDAVGDMVAISKTELADVLDRFAYGE